jgi:rubrerythrin
MLVLRVETGRGLALLGYNEDEVLVKDEPSATFEMLLKKAEQDGRLSGKYRCPVCGMRYKKEREASNCCYGIKK